MLPGRILIAVVTRRGRKAFVGGGAPVVAGWPDDQNRGAIEDAAVKLVARLHMDLGLRRLQSSGQAY